MANRAASIRARLKNRADEVKEDFNLTLTRYGLERLLYRLSISEHAPNFLLKGALLFQLWYGPAHRPTRDADLLGFGSDDVTTLIEVFRSVCSSPVDDDGIVFDTASVSGAKIREDAIYGGVRTHVRATLDRARIALQVDIGFGMANSRMKDFFDLSVLLHDQAINAAEVRPSPVLPVQRLAGFELIYLYRLCGGGVPRTLERLVRVRPSKFEPASRVDSELAMLGAFAARTKARALAIPRPSARRVSGCEFARRGTLRISMTLSQSWSAATSCSRPPRAVAPP